MGQISRAEKTQTVMRMVSLESEMKDCNSNKGIIVVEICHGQFLRVAC